MIDHNISFEVLKIMFLVRPRNMEVLNSSHIDMVIEPLVGPHLILFNFLFAL